MQNKVPEHSPPPNLLLSTVFGILVNGNSILPVYKLKPHTPHQNCWKSSQLFLQNKVRNQSYLTPPTSPLVQATDISLPDDCPNLLIPCFCTDHPVFLEKKTRQFYKTNCRMFKTLWSPPSQSKSQTLQGTPRSYVIWPHAIATISSGVVLALVPVASLFSLLWSAHQGY